MTLKTEDNSKKKTRPFLVLPILAFKMPKNPNLKLFTKTWPPKKEGKSEDRPLTATLDKPTVLNVSLIKIIDMSTVRKEFLNISNLCKFPISLSLSRRKKTAVINRPLSLPSPEKHKGWKKNRAESDEEMSVKSAKTKTAKVKMEPVPENVKKKSVNDANNNKTFKIPRKRVSNVVKLEVKSDLGKSTKLPEPCKTCGRPDLPERFHSHPATPLKLAKKVEEPPKMKSTVQKPVAMKYKSKNNEKKPLPPAPQKKAPLPVQKLVHSPPNVGTTADSPRVKSAKRTLTCYVCGREFGTASLHLHEPKCLQKWERENSSLPAHLQRKPPVKPDHDLTPEEWNKFAWESSQATLAACPNCGRTFYPDRLLVHQRSCRSPQPNGEPKRKLDLSSKVKIVFSNITVEPILVCFVLPCVMANLATQNLNMDKACRVNLQLDEEICDALAMRDTKRYNQSDEVDVQKLVATMNAWKNVIQSFVPALLLMFLGSWSDRHKRRKPCFLGPIVGEMITCLGLLLCTFFYYELPIEYNVFFEAVPPSLTGGWFAMFMAIFSYIGGITTVQTRTLRIGAVNIFVNISFTVGNALSGILYKQIGFYGIFSLSLVFYAVGFVYGACVVKEIPNEDTVVAKQTFLKDFFSVKHIAETFRVAFKKGKRNRKARICTMMVLCMVIVGPMHGEVSVLYLFVRYKFGWNEIDYSIYSTFYVITHMFGTLFSLILFTKILKVDDAALGMLSSASRILASMVYAFAPNAFVFYLGGLIEILNGTTFIAMRSIISKLVPTDELGKINSLFGLSEALVPIVYGPLYSIVYKHTIHVLPGAFFIVGGALTVPSLFIFCWLYNEHKRDEEEARSSNTPKQMYILS